MQAEKQHQIQKERESFKDNPSYVGSTWRRTTWRMKWKPWGCSGTMQELIPSPKNEYSRHNTTSYNIMVSIGGMFVIREAGGGSCCSGQGLRAFLCLMWFAKNVSY